MVNTSTESMTLIPIWEPQRKLGPIESDWKQAICDIMSTGFAVRVNVVSDLASFTQAVSSEPSVRALYEAMIASRDATGAVLRQIGDLSALEIDRRYENPNDTALAVFLLLVTLVDSDYSLVAADLVDRAPQCWYAKKIARRILTPLTMNTSNTKPLISREKATPLSSEITMMINPAVHPAWEWYKGKTSISKNEQSGLTEVSTWK